MSIETITARAEQARRAGERGQGVYITFGRLTLSPGEAIALADDIDLLVAVAEAAYDESDRHPVSERLNAALDALQGAPR